jgi:hypothetical protein
VPGQPAAPSSKSPPATGEVVATAAAGELPGQSGPSLAQNQSTPPSSQLTPGEAVAGAASSQPPVQSSPAPALASGGGAGGSAPAQGPPSPSPPLDPRLIRFIAHAASAQETQKSTVASNQDSAGDGEPGAADPNANDTAAGPSPASPLGALSILIQPAALNGAGSATAAPAAANAPPPQGPIGPSGRASSGSRTGPAQTDAGADETLAAPSVRSAGADLVRAFAELAAASSNGAQGGSLAGFGPSSQTVTEDQAAPAPGAAPTAAQIPTQAPLTLALTPTLVDTAAGSALASTYGAAITAQIAAQVTSKAAAGVSAFDFALEPQGLGRVDVSLKIDPHGQLSAVLSFDNASAAAEAKSRSAELHQALQQAGFDLSQGDLNFTSGGGQGQGAAWRSSGHSWFAFDQGQPDNGPNPSTPTSIARSTSGGLDIVI